MSHDPHLETLSSETHQKERLKLPILSKYASAGLLKSGGVNLWMYRLVVGQTALKTEPLLTQGGKPWVGGGSGHVGFFKRSQSPRGSRFMLHRPGPLGAWVLPGKNPNLWRHGPVVLGIHWHVQVSTGLDIHVWLYKCLSLTHDKNILSKSILYLKH